jgi:hypothetical protein
VLASNIFAKTLTDVKKNCAVRLTVDDMVLQDLVVEGLRRGNSRRHDEKREKINELESQVRYANN